MGSKWRKVKLALGFNTCAHIPRAIDDSSSSSLNTAAAARFSDVTSPAGGYSGYQSTTPTPSSSGLKLPKSPKMEVDNGRRSEYDFSNYYTENDGSEEHSSDGSAAESSGESISRRSDCNGRGCDIGSDSCSDSGSDSCSHSEGKLKSNNVVRTDDLLAAPSGSDLIEKEFANLDEAYSYYVTYARFAGFGVRKGDVGRDKRGVITRRIFCCCKQGLREKKHYERDGRKREAKAETRTDCKARLVVSLQKGESVWKVTKFVEDHNHELMPQNFVHLIRNYRHISKGHKAQIALMHRHGMKTSQIMGFLAGQSGGYGRIGFCKKDLVNFIESDRIRKILHGDADAALSYLEGGADVDGMTVARYTLTEEERLGNLFWADGHSRVEYQYFGDVVAFDSTYKKNRYKKPLVIFSGQNHHRQTCIFGYALLVDERIETYQWLLEQFLQVMADKQPSVVVTDGDEAMKEAIKRVFPSATHRLCAWHLNKNVVANVKNDDFTSAFKLCCYAKFKEDEFLQFWGKSVSRCGVSENAWVRGLFEKKEMWAAAYLRDKFCAGVKTTSHCEGLNGQVKRFVRSRCSILELVQNLERALKDLRNNELEAQFQSIYTHPVYDTGLHSIEVAAAKVYTRKIFKEVKQQILAISSVIMVSRDRICTTVKYQLCKFGEPNRLFDVFCDKVGDEKGPMISCDCCFWRMEGIPCSHIFYVMKEEHIPELPSSLVLRRWRKDAKTFHDDEESDEDSMKRQLLRYGALASASLWMSFLASKSGPYFKKAMNMVIGVTNDLEVRHAEDGGGLKRVRDPTISKTKGAPKLSKRDRRKRLCSNCSKVGHTKRTCPNIHNYGVGSDDDYMEDLHSNEDSCHRQSAAHEAGSSRRRMTSQSDMHSTDGVQCQMGSAPFVPNTYGNMFFGGQYINQIFPPGRTEGDAMLHSRPSETASVHNMAPPKFAPQGSVDPGHQYILQQFMQRGNNNNIP